MTTDGKPSIYRTAKKGDAWEITGPCIIRVVTCLRGSCRLEIEAENAVHILDLDKPPGPDYDHGDKQPTEAA